MKIFQKAITKEQESAKALLAQELNPIYAHVLATRGVASIQEAKYQYKLIPPEKLKGVDLFAERLIHHIARQSKMCILADFDCDGATSCAIAYLGIKMLGSTNIDYAVPNRIKHGYGLSRAIIDDLIKEKGKPEVIITVDNGIAAHDGVIYANELGIEVLVTDHHLPIRDKENPPAYALVNPNQAGDTSTLNNMAGCGVIFYCLMATLNKMIKSGQSKQGQINLLPLMDLVSLGTIADVVKLDKNNRLLVKYGLSILKRQQARMGIKSLFKVSKRDISIANSRDYGFSIGPRINAAGRLEDMSTGIRCLVETDPALSQRYANELNEWNVRRKEIENQMKEQAIKIIDDESQNDQVSRVVFDPYYHEGVVGIVAARIKEKSNCPTIVFAPTEDENKIKGSGRSIPEVHIRDALDYVNKTDPSIIISFGGHAMAAGVAIRKDKLNEFKKLFEESIVQVIGTKALNKEIEYDLELPLKDINIELAKILEDEIWGQGFIEPIFKSRLKVKDLSFLQKDEINVHSKITFEGADGDIEALHFFNTDVLNIDDEINVLYRLGVNRFRDEEKLSLVILEKNFD